MNFTTKENNIIDAFRLYQTEFFKIANKRKFNMFDFAVEYESMKLILAQCSTEALESSDFQLASSYAQFDLITFLGLDGKHPTHEILKNPNAFAAILGMLIRRDEFPSLYLDKLRIAINMHSEKKCDLASRNLWFYTAEETKNLFNDLLRLYVDEGKRVGSSVFDTNVFKKKFKSRLSTLINKKVESSLKFVNQNLKEVLSPNKTLRCFRGFNIRRDEDVRLNRYYSKNDNKYVHVGGRGISYTLDKQCAKQFAAQPFIRKNEIGEYQRRVDASSLLPFHSYVDKTPPDPRDRIGYVGLVETSVSDIFLNLSLFLENEILVLPENTRIIRYDTVRYGV